MSLQFARERTVIGLAVAAIRALIALGFPLRYNSTRIRNRTRGELVLFGTEHMEQMERL
jgi:branched-subunit amino acid ABC-type transport system permease component